MHVQSVLRPDTDLRTFWTSPAGLNKIVQVSYAKALWLGLAPIANEESFSVCKGILAILLDGGPPCFHAELFAQGLVPATLRAIWSNELKSPTTSLLCTSAQVAIHKVYPDRVYVDAMEVLRQRALVQFAYALRPETFSVSEVQAIVDCEQLRFELLNYWNVPVYDE
jgi:hypothetical protein